MIIGVFGGSSNVPRDVLDLAADVSRRIAENDIVLCGATAAQEGGVPAATKIKFAAAAAAGGNPWLGIGQGNGFEVRPRKAAGFSFDTGLGNARNFLEAYLCDGAIALPGGAGTQSEVIFCLLLQRPVVLLGDWTASTPLVQHLITAQPAITKYVKDAELLAGKTNRPDFDSLLEESVSKGKSAQSFPLDHASTADCAFEKVRRMVIGMGLKGHFPALKDVTCVAAGFSNWINEHKSRRLNGGIEALAETYVLGDGA